MMDKVMDNLKGYLVDDCDYIVSSRSLKEIKDYYKKEINPDIEDDSISEFDIDNTLVGEPCSHDQYQNQVLVPANEAGHHQYTEIDGEVCEMLSAREVYHKARTEMISNSKEYNLNAVDIIIVASKEY